MSSYVLFQLILLAFLLMCSAFFSASESAIMSVNRIRIRNLSDNGVKRAENVLKLLDDRGRVVSVILIGNNVVNIAASSIATSVALEIFGNAGVAVATGVMTIVILLFGEIAPKTIATAISESVTLRTSGILLFLSKLLSPVLWFTSKFTSGLSKLFGIDNQNEVTVSEDELYTIIDVSHEEGVIESNEKKMLTNVFKFMDILVKKVMIPHIDIVAVEINDSYSEIKKTFENTTYSKLPVYSETLDDIRGFLILRDFFKYEGDPKDFKVEDLMEEPFFIYEGKRASDLFNEMNTRSKNIAIVVDEFGSTSGLVALNDLAAEIFGELAGELPETGQRFVKLSDSEFLVSGRMFLDDLDELLGLNLNELTESQTIAGFLIEQTGHIPSKGEKIVHENLAFTIVRVDGNKVISVNIKILDNDSHEQ
ncbi:MAG: HlyC/CorC family transporter [Methanosarcinaceae archaeon]|nr:HlyC/CorC family transporter [Methanosarcinaceae archaeon]